jgi:cell division inhibitor SepF
LFSRLRAVVSGDDYFDGAYDDELDYDGGELDQPASTASSSRNSALALTSDFSSDEP